VALPGTAGAATFCVHQPSAGCGPGQVDKGADLQGALDDALASNGPDDVLVGAGEYSGPFAYGGAQAVNIRGAGDSTVLRAPNANGTTVLDTGIGGAASSVSNLRIDVPVGNTSMTNLGLQSRGGASRVNVVIPANLTGFAIGVQMASGSFARGSVTGPTQEFPGYYAIALAGGLDAPILVEDSTFQGFEALALTGAATVRRVSAVARTGFQFQSENPAGGVFLIEDSVWRTPPGAVDGVGLHTGCGSNVDLQVTARNLTLVNGATGSGFNYGVAAICNLVGRSASVDLSSSIVLGSGQSLRALANGGPATVDVAYTDYDPTKTEVVGATGAIDAGPGNLNVPPGFAGPADLSLLRTSPLVNAGDPAGVAAGESLTDVAGRPRIAFGRRDIGAYELQPLPPTAPPTTGPKSDARAPTLSRLRLDPRRFRAGRRPRGKPTTRIRFRLSETGTVRLRIQRVLSGRRAGGRCRKPTRKLRHARPCKRYRGVGTLVRRKRSAGANAITFNGWLGRKRLQPRPFRALATATDPAGNRSRSHGARFRVLEPRG
jgi:hypothetical protein